MTDEVWDENKEQVCKWTGGLCSGMICKVCPYDRSMRLKGEKPIC